MKPLRLLFIPHAGGSMLSYGKFYQRPHPEIEVEILDLPGRNKYINDEWPIPWEKLIPILYERVRHDQRPTIIMGHSFGSLVAFMLASYMHDNGHKILLVASGLNAPTEENWKQRERISRLPEIEFKERLKRLGQIKDDIPAQFFNLIKSDFIMLESFPLGKKSPIPALSFIGSEDPLTSFQKAQAWGELVDLQHPPFTLTGNHFQFFLNHLNTIMEEVIKYIK
jgi:surfactin synthase thioesterase subunit